MAAWRRRALERFPTLRRNLQRRDYSIYMLYFDLLPMVRDAHGVADKEALRNIYGFAEWCFRQRSEDLPNAAAVAFYEHLFDRRSDWSAVIPWLSPSVLAGCWPLWEARLPPDEFEELKGLVATRTNTHYYDIA